MPPSVHIIVKTPLLMVSHSAFIALYSPLILQIIGVKQLSDRTSWLCISLGSPCTPVQASSCKPSAWPAYSPSCVTVFEQSAVQCSAQSRHPYFVQVLFSTNRYAHSTHHTHLSILSSQQTPHSYSAVPKIIFGLPSNGVKVPLTLTLSIVSDLIKIRAILTESAFESVWQYNLQSALWIPGTKSITLFTGLTFIS